MSDKSRWHYDPTLTSLVKRTNQDWGDPEINRKNLIFYGIPPIDQALYGIDIVRGELLGIQAQEKNRKSTFLANIVFNIAYQFKSKGYSVCIDTLESGMPPSAYRDVLISISSSRWLIGKRFGENRTEWPSIDIIRGDGILQRELTISKEFLWYGRWSKLQDQAINTAKATLSDFPISIFGPSTEEGNARNLEESLLRWDLLYNGTYPGAYGIEHRVFCVDHVQQYYGFGSNKFQQMEEVVSAQSNFVVTHPGSVVIQVSQVSLTSARLQQEGTGEMYAKGGGALAAEATTLFFTQYNKDMKPDEMNIGVFRTRKRPFPDLVQELDRESGAFLRPAYPR